MFMELYSRTSVSWINTYADDFILFLYDRKIAGKMRECSIENIQSKTAAELKSKVEKLGLTFDNH